MPRVRRGHTTEDATRCAEVSPVDGVVSIDVGVHGCGVRPLDVRVDSAWPPAVHEHRAVPGVLHPWDSFLSATLPNKVVLRCAEVL